MLNSFMQIEFEIMPSYDFNLKQCHIIFIFPNMLLIPCVNLQHGNLPHSQDDSWEKEVEKTLYHSTDLY